MLIVVAQAFRLMEFHLIRFYLLMHLHLSVAEEENIVHWVLDLKASTWEWLHIIFLISPLSKCKSDGPACIPTLYPEGVSEYFEIVLIWLYLVMWISIHLDQIEFSENREIGNHLFLLCFITPSVLITFQRLLPLLSVVGQIIAFIFDM